MARGSFQVTGIPRSRLIPKKYSHFCALDLSLGGVSVVGCVMQEVYAPPRALSSPGAGAVVRLLSGTPPGFTSYPGGDLLGQTGADCV